VSNAAQMKGSTTMNKYTYTNDYIASNNLKLLTVNNNGFTQTHVGTPKILNTLYKYLNKTATLTKITDNQMYITANGPKGGYIIYTDKQLLGAQDIIKKLNLTNVVPVQRLKTFLVRYYKDEQAYPCGWHYTYIFKGTIDNIKPEVYNYDLEEYTQEHEQARARFAAQDEERRAPQKEYANTPEDKSMTQKQQQTLMNLYKRFNISIDLTKPYTRKEASDKIKAITTAIEAGKVKYRKQVQPEQQPTPPAPQEKKSMLQQYKERALANKQEPQPVQPEKTPEPTPHTQPTDSITASINYFKAKRKRV